MLSASWRESSGPLAERLAAEMRASIGSGRWSPGAPLPSERELAERAGVSRTTVNAAVDLLVATGWAVRHTRARPTAALPAALNQPLAPIDALSDGVIDLRPARLSAPADLLLDATDRARSQLTPFLLGSGRLPLGLPALRHAIAERWTAQGLTTVADQVVVTNGAMGALQACLDMRPGTVLVEDPTYQNAVRILLQRRRKLALWERGAQWDIERLGTALRRYRPSLAYLVPDFHNPTGALATNVERWAVGQVAPAFPDTTWVIDETLRELDLRTTSQPLPRPFATFLPRAITIGGLSKTMWSGLRVGWIRMPKPADALAVASFAEAAPVPVLDQLLALELWPHLDEVVAIRVARLRRQRDALVAQCRQAGLLITVPPGGLACWIDLGRPVAGAIAEQLGTEGILVAPGRMFGGAGGYDRFIRMPFTHEPDVVGGAMNRIIKLLDR